jgi:hypothetical protein
MPSANVGSGEALTTLSAWITSVAGSATATYEAILTSDISDSVSLSGITNNKTLVIKTDGTRRTVTSDNGGAVILCNHSAIVSLTIQDITVNCNGDTQIGINIQETGGPVTIDSVLVHGSASNGIHFTNDAQDAAGQTHTVQNCIVRDCVDGIEAAKTAVTSTIEIRNCLCIDNSGLGIDLNNNANSTVNIRNTVSMNNTGGDIDAANTTSTNNVLNSVTSDTSGTSGNHDSSTGTVISKTSYTDYFDDYAGNDFHLKASANSLWSVTGDGATTPADDFEGTARSTDDVGPYEFGSSQSPVPIIIQRLLR